MEELSRGCSKVCPHWTHASRSPKTHLPPTSGGGSNTPALGYTAGRFSRKAGHSRRAREAKWHKGREKTKMKNKHYLTNGNLKYLPWTQYFQWNSLTNCRKHSQLTSKLKTTQRKTHLTSLSPCTWDEAYGLHTGLLKDLQISPAGQKETKKAVTSACPKRCMLLKYNIKQQQSGERAKGEDVKRVKEKLCSLQVISSPFLASRSPIRVQESSHAAGGRGERYHLQVLPAESFVSWGCSTQRPTSPSSFPPRTLGEWIKLAARETERGRARPPSYQAEVLNPFVGQPAPPGHSHAAGRPEKERRRPGQRLQRAARGGAAGQRLSGSGAGAAPARAGSAARGRGFRALRLRGARRAPEPAGRPFVWATCGGGPGGGGTRRRPQPAGRARNSHKDAERDTPT